MSQSTKRPQAHNLTPDDLADLQATQMAGETGKTKAGNMDDGYRFPANETHLVHAEITPRSVDGEGNIVKNPFVQKFYMKEFKETEGSGGFAGKKVAILHNPEEGDAVDLDENEDSNPKIRRTDGYSIPLDESVDAMSAGEIQDLYERLYPEGVAKKKQERIAAIKSAHAFLIENPTFPIGGGLYVLGGGVNIGSGGTAQGEGVTKPVDEETGQPK